MTSEIVDHETGEIVETIGADEARRLTTEAQNEFRSSREHFDRAWSLIEQAVEGGGHVVLGYRSPGDYLHHEFDGVLSGLDVPQRRIAVKTMSEWGLSTRAIAPVLGVNNATVHRDRAGVADATPDLVFISATNALGEMDAAEDMDEDAFMDAVGDTTAEEFDAALAKAREGGDLSRTNVAKHVEADSTPSNVIGIDGKTYKRPPPKPTPVAPVANKDEWSEQDRAEELAGNLARNLSLLYAITNPERRADYIATWRLGTQSRPVLGQNFITPEHMRRLADALNDFAKEWETANV